MFFRLLSKAFQVDKIWNYFNVPMDSESGESFSGQVGRNGGNPIGLIDAESHNRFVAWIFTNQRNIGSVQSRNHRNMNAFRSQNLLGQVRSRCMGNGIMYVQ